MRPQQQVLVTLDGISVPGLLLKWRTGRQRALVTYEFDGKVSTQWVPIEQVQPMPDPPLTSVVTDGSSD